MIRALAIALVVSSVTAHAEPHHTADLWAGVDATLAPERDAHGIVLVRYQLDGLPRDGRITVEYNTDTLRAAAQLRAGRFELGAVAGGELFIAGLLDDYWRNGHSDGARGFFASWIEGAAFAKLDLHPSFLELAVGARRWFFSRDQDTSRELTLPPEAWVGEWRLRYTLWSLAPDPSLWEAHRPFPRLRGVAFGLELGADARSQARPWGARDPSSFAPTDLRNDPRATVLSARQWLRAGARLTSRLRLQIEEVALWMSGADDLDRARVGGLNPYVVTLAGAPWAGYLAGKLAAAQLSLHVRVWRELELGLIADGVAVDDLARTGAPLRPALLAGVGALADFRLGAWQVDLRGGYSPTVPNGFSLFASLGWGWRR